MEQRPLIIGAHMGGLARAQADRLVRLLRRTRPRFRIELMTVTKRTRRPAEVHAEHFAENRGAVRTLHQLLRDGEIDVVIHRGFDLRADPMQGFEIAAVLPRSSPYDALLSGSGLTLDELDAGTKVGITQLRTRVQLREHRPDLELQLLTGDVGTWLTELIERRIEALVMPNAALEHLGLQGRVCEIFPPDLILPSAGAGVLICVTRAGDDTTAQRLTPLNDPVTAAEFSAELALMDGLGCEWDSAAGTLAQARGRSLRLLAMVARADGSGLMRQGLDGRTDDPVTLGRELAELLLEDGAGALLRPADTEGPGATAALVARNLGPRSGRGFAAAGLAALEDAIESLDDAAGDDDFGTLEIPEQDLAPETDAEQTPPPPPTRKRAARSAPPKRAARGGGNDRRTSASQRSKRRKE
jgi:hydroxymethylbilane synthase